jgi:RimJ/RimL family protein N-acetyltransferase
MNTIRKATPADAVLFYELASDPESRSASVNREPIVWTDHLNWFQKVTTSAEHWLYVFENKGMPSGIIRFQLTDEGPSLSYTIAPHARGLGLSNALLSLGIQRFAADSSFRTVVGVIAEENIRSQKAFAKVDFVETGTISIDGRTFKKYALELNETNDLPSLSKREPPHLYPTE